MKFKVTALWVLLAVWQYLRNWISLLDRAFNVLLFGDPRQTLSSRMGRNVAAGRCPLCGWICRRLDFFETAHCAKAWAGEQIPLVPDMQVTGD